MSVRDVRLGEVEDVLLDADARRLLGLVVLCGDGNRRMLPLAAADLNAGDQVGVHSALVLMDDGFYRLRGHMLTALAGAAVLRGGAELGRLQDVRADAEGRVVAYVVEGSGDATEIAPVGEVALDAGAAAPAL